jgi:tight adherence protein C
MGLWLLMSMIPRLDQGRLERRIAPYLLDVSEGARAAMEAPSAGPLPVLVVALRPLVAPVAAPLRVLVGHPGQIASRVRRAAGRTTVEAYRLQQAACALLGSAVGIAAVVAGRGGVPLGVVGAVAGAIGGVVARDALLARRVRRRMARLAAELPVILEFLALSLSAGEGVLDALRRVSRTGRGDLAAELSVVLASVTSGVPLPEALGRLERELELPALSRALEQLIGALERGSPLGEVLRAQAQDARELTRRDLLESAGRKEIGMLVPLVFLILPVTVLFAVFPATLVLQLGF